MSTKIIYLRLTDRCQLNCDHCYDVDNRSGCMISNDAWRVAFNYVLEYKYQGHDVEVQLHGGEPMLNDSLEEVYENVQKLVKLGAKVSCTTNLCYAITDNMWRIFELFDNKLILTSWDYNIRFKTDVQELTWEYNVQLLKDKGFNVQPIITITKPLIENMKPMEIFGYMKALGLNRLNFERLTPNGNAVKNEAMIRPTNRQVDAWLAQAYKDYKLRFNEFEVPLFIGLELAKQGELTGCRARQCTCNVRTINTRGDVATCPNIAKCLILPNLMRHDNDMYIRKFRENLDTLQATESTRHDECYICPHFKICNGDCFQLAWDSTGCPGLRGILEVL